MPSRRLDPRVIDDLSNVVEERISEKVKENFRSKMEEVIASFRSKMVLMKSDMIAEIISAIGGVHFHVSTKDFYEFFFEDFEVAKLSSENITNHMERPMGNRVGLFVRLGSQ